ncbi:hypothetical protein LUZ60_008841 [Juncus effusus]|nr:hypothetical protein LUZ60_008841 [Juncus effusus]
MQGPKKFNKQVFLKHLLLGLQISNSSSNPITIQQRMNSIKLSADLAMAIARGRTCWTCALISKHTTKEDNKPLLMSILGRRYETLVAKYACPLLHYKMQTTKKIVRASKVCSSRKRRALINESFARVSPSVLARNLMKKRTKMLRKLVPGGEDLDGFSLLSETLDYVTSLKAQVDLMQGLWKATQISSSRAMFKCMLEGKEVSCSSL